MGLPEIGSEKQLENEQIKRFVYLQIRAEGAAHIRVQENVGMAGRPPVSLSYSSSVIRAPSRAPLLL